MSQYKSYIRIGLEGQAQLTRDNLIANALDTTGRNGYEEMVRYGYQQEQNHKANSPSWRPIKPGIASAGGPWSRIFLCS